MKRARPWEKKSVALETEQRANRKTVDGIMALALRVAHLELACRQALDHIEELEEAWRRGIIDERDGKGGTRSNRNVEVRVALRKALDAENEEGVR